MVTHLCTHEPVELNWLPGLRLVVVGISKALAT